MLADPAFRSQIDALVQSKKKVAQTPAWFQQYHPQSPLTCVAYFSMEFMLSEALPIYSGGLGNVAGDQLKTASDLGVPVVGVGLLFQQGYFVKSSIKMEHNKRSFLITIRTVANHAATASERRVVTVGDRFAWLLSLDACVAGPGRTG